MIITRYNPMGLQYSLSEDGAKTQITLVNRRTGADPIKRIVVDSPLSEMSQRWYNWQMNRQNIQVAFNNLSAEEREFLMTGITPSEWKEIFKEGEE